MKIHPRLAMLALSASVAAGCGSDSADDASDNANGSTETASASQAADPCSLITKEEVSAVIGEPVLQASAQGETCNYETEDAAASSVAIEVQRSDGRAEMQGARQAFGVLDKMGTQMAKGQGVEVDVGKTISDGAAVTGIGDEAFFGPNQVVHVLKNNVYFTVTPPIMRSRMGAGNPMLPAEKKREIAQTIAGKVASKL